MKSCDENDMKENETLQQTGEVHTIITPAAVGIKKYFVIFDDDSDNLEGSFDTDVEAYQYAKDNIQNVPQVIKLEQSDTKMDMGYGDDYSETDITECNEELAEILAAYREKIY